MTPTESDYIRREIVQMRAHILRDVFEAIRTTTKIIGPGCNAKLALEMLERELSRKINP